VTKSATTAPPKYFEESTSLEKPYPYPSRFHQKLASNSTQTLDKSEKKSNGEVQSKTQTPLSRGYLGQSASTVRVGTCVIDTDKPYQL
jgi:hypothetical protein